MGDEVRVEPGQLTGKADDVDRGQRRLRRTHGAVRVHLRPVGDGSAQSGCRHTENFVASGNREASRLATVLRTAADVYDNGR